MDVRELVRQDSPDSVDRKTLEWKRKKIGAALEQVASHPDEVVPISDILEKHGLED
jgi:hypothetical protein